MTSEAKQLYVAPLKPDLPRCEAIRGTKYANDHTNSDRQCKWSAYFDIGGKKLCRKHAGQEALRILLKGTSNDQ